MQMRSERLFQGGINERRVSSRLLVLARGKLRFSGVQRETGMQQPGTRGRRRLLHHFFCNDQGGPVFALPKKGGGQTQARDGRGAVGGESAFEKGFGFGECSTGEDNVGHVLQQRSVVWRNQQCGAELRRNRRRVERI
jgi:hypothetical protein